MLCWPCARTSTFDLTPHLNLLAYLDAQEENKARGNLFDKVCQREDKTSNETSMKNVCHPWLLAARSDEKNKVTRGLHSVKCGIKLKHFNGMCRHQGTSLLKHLGGQAFILFAFRWRRHVHSTVVWLSCKIGAMGRKILENIYFGDGPSDPSLRSRWWYSNWYCTMGLYLNCI